MLFGITLFIGIWFLEGFCAAMLCKVISGKDTDAVVATAVVCGGPISIVTVIVVLCVSWLLVPNEHNTPNI